MLLFVTRKYPPSVGGMEKHSFELSRALARRHPVQLVAWGGSQRRLPSFLAETLREAFRLRRRGVPVHGVHLGDALLAPLGLGLGRLLNAPVTASVHGLDVTYPPRPYQAAVPAALARCAAVLCNSRATLHACVERGIDPARCQVIPPGVAAGPLRALADPSARGEARERAARRFGGIGPGPIVLCVGRLVRRKGAAWFVESVVPRLAQSTPDVGVWIVGEGPERERIDAAIEQQGLRERARLLGPLSDDDLALAYAAADCFAMPNVPVPADPEGFGIAALDASVAGLWVYAARQDGIPDAVQDGQNGTLLPPENAACWTEALVEAVQDPLCARLRGAAGRDYTLDRFSWPAIGDAYAAVFAELGMLR